MQTDNLTKIAKHRKYLLLMMWKIAFCLYSLFNSLCVSSSAWLGRRLRPGGRAVTWSADRFVLHHRSDLQTWCVLCWRISLKKVLMVYGLLNFILNEIIHRGFNYKQSTTFSLHKTFTVTLGNGKTQPFPNKRTQHWVLACETGRSPATFHRHEAEGYFTFWFVSGPAVNFLQSKWALAIDQRINLLRSTSPRQCSVAHLPRARRTRGEEKQLNLYRERLG